MAKPNKSIRWVESLPVSKRLSAAAIRRIADVDQKSGRRAAYEQLAAENENVRIRAANVRARAAGKPTQPLVTEPSKPVNPGLRKDDLVKLAGEEYRRILMDKGGIRIVSRSKHEKHLQGQTVEELRELRRSIKTVFQSADDMREYARGNNSAWYHF